MKERFPTVFEPMMKQTTQKFEKIVLQKSLKRSSVLYNYHLFRNFQNTFQKTVFQNMNTPPHFSMQIIEQNAIPTLRSSNVRVGTLHSWKASMLGIPLKQEV